MEAGRAKLSDYKDTEVSIVLTASLCPILSFGYHTKSVLSSVPQLVILQYYVLHHLDLRSKIYVY
jgi:hypothetical protein